MSATDDRVVDLACPDEQINHAIMDSAGLPAGRMSG